MIAAGAAYLRIEGACYMGIGCLFLLYGYYRAVKRPGMSVVLTVISLGTRVALAYGLSAVMGVTGIWLSIPIGWALADAVGLSYMTRTGKRLRQEAGGKKACAVWTQHTQFLCSHGMHDLSVGDYIIENFRSGSDGP